MGYDLVIKSFLAVCYQSTNPLPPQLDYRVLYQKRKSNPLF